MAQLMTPGPPPQLHTLIARAIIEKTSDFHAGRQEVCAAVLSAINLVRQCCPACGAEAFALPDVALTCTKCQRAMLPASTSTQP